MFNWYWNIIWSFSIFLLLKLLEQTLTTSKFIFYFWKFYLFVQCSFTKPKAITFTFWDVSKRIWKNQIICSVKPLYSSSTVFVSWPRPWSRHLLAGSSQRTAQKWNNKIHNHYKNQPHWSSKILWQNRFSTLWFLCCFFLFLVFLRL